MDGFYVMEKYIVLILVSLLILLGGAYWWNAHLNAQLREAEAETEVAINELQRIKGVSAFQKAELERITIEMDRRIMEADKQIASLTDQVSIRKSLIAQLKADNERLNNALLTTINLPVEDPLPPDELLRKAEQLYYPRDFGLVELSGNPGGLELLQVMLREIEQRRELDFSNANVITEQDKQIAGLGKIISEQESRYFGLQTKFDTQSGLVTSLEGEIVQYDSVVAGLNKQIGILNKPRFWGSWQGQAVAVAGLMGGIYIGSHVK